MPRRHLVSASHEVTAEPTLKPNHRQVLAAKAADGKRTRYMIEGVQGLMLDVAPRGSRYWYVRYQMPGDRQAGHSASIGSEMRGRSVWPTP